MIDKQEVLVQLLAMANNTSSSIEFKTLTEAIALIQRYAPDKRHPNYPLKIEELPVALDQINGMAKYFKGHWNKAWSLHEAAEYFRTQLNFVETQQVQERQEMWGDTK